MVLVSNVEHVKGLVKRIGIKKTLLKLIRRLILGQSRLAQRLDVVYHFKKFFKGHAIVDNINGFKMHLDLRNDEGISRDLFLFKKREHLSIDFLQNQNFINRGGTALDIGGNIGYYALLESSLVGPEGKVYAVEPVSSNLNILKKNIELNGVKNINVFKIAMGKEKKNVEIYVSNQSNRSSFIVRSGTVYTKKEKVEMTTVDDFVSEHKIKPDFIRMDVEGYEKEIIQGMRKTLLDRPKLFIEIHPNEIGREELKQMFLTMLESGYGQVTVVERRDQGWMKRNGEIKPVLRYLAWKIEGREGLMGMGKVEHLALTELYKRVDGIKDAFCAFIS